MKPIRSNTGFIAGTVANVVNNQDNSATVWIDHVETWQSNGSTQQRQTQVNCYFPKGANCQKGELLFVKAALKTFKAQGQNNSEVTVTYYYVTDVLGHCPAGGLLSCNAFTLGGNVGSVEMREANGKKWYNVSLALTRSYQDENQQWQDETHWARLSINEKLFNQNFKQGLNTGDSLMVDCELNTNSYTDKHGNNVLGNEFRVNRVLSLVSKAELGALKQAGSHQTNQPGYQAPAQQQPAQNAPAQQPAQNQAPQNAPAQQQSRFVPMQ